MLWLKLNSLKKLDYVQSILFSNNLFIAKVNTIYCSTPESAKAKSQGLSSPDLHKLVSILENMYNAGGYMVVVYV